MTLTKNQSCVLAIIGCVSIFVGLLGEGILLTDILLVFGGAVISAALIIPPSEI